MKFSLRSLVAIACLATISVATPATADGGWKHISKDCRRAGLKTKEDCDAFHAARGNNPAATPLAKAQPAAPVAAATTGSGGPSAPSALDAMLKATGGAVAGALAP
jgi:hypothetical protein